VARDPAGSNRDGVAACQHLINRTAADVYAYASNPANLPAWAPGLLRSVERVDGQWVADSDMGRILLDWAPDNPFGGSAWRRERGALWDTGPHALSTLIGALGPVAAVTAVAGDGDLVTLVLRHESGPTSTVVLSQFAPPAAVSFECTLWGDAGLAPMPQRPDDLIVDIYATAASELIASAADGRRSDADVRLGAAITRLLADAQRQIDQARPTTAVTRLGAPTG